MRHHEFVVPGAVFALLSAVAPLGAQAACPRPAPRQFADGDVVTIRDGRPPCRIQLVETPIVLRTDAAGLIADIGATVYRAPDGKFVTYTSRGELSIWTADGRFLKNIGREGRGPGEFAIGPVSVHFDRTGAVFARDNNQRWTRLTPAFEYLNNASAAGMEYSIERAAMLDDGMYLSGGVSRNGAHYFNVYDPQKQGDAAAASGPPIVRSFGDVPTAERALPPTSRERLVAYSGGTTFWAGPPRAAGRGYELELWSTDGRLLRTIRRVAAWFPKGADRQPPRASEGTATREPTQLSLVASDTTGLLLVAVFRTNESWKPVPVSDREAYIANRNASGEIRIEVIDTRSGTLLVSSEPMTRAQLEEQFMSGIIRGTSLGYKRGFTADDMRMVRMVEWKLVRQ